MTETSPVSFQSRCRRSAGKARLDGRPHPPACRGEGGRRRRRDRAGRRARRTLHARLFGDAGLLGRRGEDRARRSTPTAGCTPAISPRSTPTAIATSSAGSRTWSSAAARTSIRARSRSSSTAIPRSARCRCSACRTENMARSSAPGSCSKPGETAHRGRDQGLLRGPDRPLQGPALCALQDRTADDGDRQAAEIHHARADGRGTRAGHRQNRVVARRALFSRATPPHAKQLRAGLTARECWRRAPG